MALDVNKPLVYDPLRAPDIGHALEELLIRRGDKYEWRGSFSFQTKKEYEDSSGEIGFFALKYASEEMNEIDPWTGDPKNKFSYHEVRNEVPTWNELVTEHRENLAEYAAYEGKRNRSYPDWREQLDMLYKDIDAGKLGETAKTSTFYQAIKEVKDANP